jgi:hypothetical protein
MEKPQKLSLSFLLVMILSVTSSSIALSQSEAQSWIKRRLTYNASSSDTPVIARSGNNVHVVWVDLTPGNAEIFYKRSTDNGATWGKSKRLTNNAGASWQPSLAVSGSKIHVVWVDDTPGNNEIFFRRSSDNGASWAKTKRLTYTTGSSFSPTVAVSGSDVHVVWGDTTPGNWEVFYRRSSNDGATWGKKRRLTKDTGVSTNPSIGVSGSDIHVVWEDNRPGNLEIYHKRSTDNGATWSKAKRLTVTAGTSRYADIEVSGSFIHVVWRDETPGNKEVYYLRSTDNGATWGSTRRLTNNAGNSERQAIAVSGSNVHVVWQDDTPGNLEIFYKSSSNNGAKWVKKVRLTHKIGESRSPDPAASGTNVHVVWTDSKPSNFEIFYKRGP